MRTKLLLVAGAAALVAACSSNEPPVGQQQASGSVLDLLGLNREGADPAMVRNPPLSVPPDFDLRPPAGGGSASSGLTATARGRAAILGESAATISGRSAGESALVRKAGLAPGIDNSIRREVDREAVDGTGGEDQFVDKLVRYEDDPDVGSTSGSTPAQENPKPVIKRRGEIF